MPYGQNRDEKKKRQDDGPVAKGVLQGLGFNRPPPSVKLSGTPGAGAGSPNVDMSYPERISDPKGPPGFKEFYNDKLTSGLNQTFAGVKNKLSQAAGVPGAIGRGWDSLSGAVAVDKPTGGGPSGIGDVARGILNMKGPQVPGWPMTGPVLGGVGVAAAQQQQPVPVVAPTQPANPQPGTTTGRAPAVQPTPNPATTLASPPNPQAAQVQADIDKQKNTLAAAGITRTQDMQAGTNTFTMGEPGMPGSARATVPIGFQTGRRADGSSQARQQIAGPRSQYSFQGSEGDAAKFFAPVSRPAQTAATRMAAEPLAYRQIRDSRGDGSSAPKMPEYLGPESGLGWKTRLGKYKADLDAYGRETGNQTSMDIERMRETGAGARSALMADQANKRDQMMIDQGRPAAEMEQELMNVQRQLASTTPGTPEHQTLMNQYRALSGNFAQPEKPNILTGKEYDQYGNTVGETFNRYNPETGAMERIPVSGQGGQAPAEAVDFLIKNSTPENKKFFMEKYGYLPEGA